MTDIIVSTVDPMIDIIASKADPKTDIMIMATQTIIIVKSQASCQDASPDHKRTQVVRENLFQDFPRHVSNPDWFSP